MNPQSWIAIASLVVSVLLALFVAVARYAEGQREKAMDAQFKAMGDQVQAANARITSVECKLETKLDAILVGQTGIQKELGELKAKMEFERGSSTGVDTQLKQVWDTFLTKEVFDTRMTGLDREVRDIKSNIAELSKRHR